MSKAATTALLIAVIAIGLITAYLAVNAASVPFAIQMAVMVLWSVAFCGFIVRRSGRRT